MHGFDCATPPWLEINFTKGGPSSTLSRNRPCTFDVAELPAAAEMRSHGGDVPRGKSNMLAFSSHLPPANERRFEVHDLASLAALSRKVGLTWGVFLEWYADGE